MPIHRDAIPTLHPPKNRGDRRDQCPNGHTFIPIAAYLWDHRRQQLENSFNANFKDDFDEFLKWLVIPDPEHHTKALAILLWYDQLLQSERDLQTTAQLLE
jgi:hypothetical protein